MLQISAAVRSDNKEKINSDLNIYAWTQFVLISLAIYNLLLKGISVVVNKKDIILLEIVFRFSFSEHIKDIY